ncbi:putative cytoplasmic protein [Escherichia coli 09BKT078844]|nr:putative cytoplasmic protein [Escherichia coli 09BKT078844]
MFIQECISGGLSATRKVSDAGAAGILNPMQANNLMRGSPVKGFPDNKPHSFHPSGRVFSGRRGFFIYTA